ncbi:MAG TPA: glycosyltransferase family 4 protein [Usitatibacter sp.]|nr:glycosyltransferase family 4 protein [Usitatibacter sp.]
MSPAPRPPGLAPRVALVRGRYDPAGGAERFVQNAIAALKAQGASLTIVTRHWPGHDGSALVLNPFHVGSLWRDWAFARAVCREAGHGRFDLVQSHERIACCDVYRAGDGVHAQWLAERAKVQSPLARLATRLDPHHRYVLAAERALFTSPRLRAVICNSIMVRDEIERHFGTGGDRLVVIRNAVDATLFHPGLRTEMREAMRQQLSIPRDARVAVHVGSGFERKGVRALLQAAARAASRPWVVVVGRDKHSARYQALASALGISGRVRFAGAVSDVRPFHACADAFVLATLYDPQPNAALEAMASGLPVVTSRKCGVAELLREGESGFIRDALDVAGLAEALDSLDPPAAARMGAAAREAVAPYTPEAMAAEYLALYQRLLHR